MGRRKSLSPASWHLCWPGLSFNVAPGGHSLAFNARHIFGDGILIQWHLQLQAIQWRNSNVYIGSNASLCNVQGLTCDAILIGVKHRLLNVGLQL